MFIKKYKNSFLFGLLAGLAFLPIYLLIFLPVGFYYIITKIVDLLDTVEDKKLLKSFLYGTIFGFGYYLSQLYWISFSLLVDIKTYFWLFPFAVVAIPIACALYFGCTTMLLFYILKKSKIKNKFVISLIFSFLYVFFEYVRGLIFPWNLFAYILGFSNLFIQIVRYINIYIFDFILVLFFSFGYVLFKYNSKKLTIIKENRHYIPFYIFIILFLFLFGELRLSNAKPKKFNLNFRLVQANIPQTLKWDRNESEHNITKYIDLSTSQGYDNIDVVVWSESSIPYILTENSSLGIKFNGIGDKILIGGAIRGEIKNGELEKIWNSIFIFKNGKIIDYYDKTILVPFGEYIPFSKYLPFIKKITEGDIEFSKGNSNKTIDLGEIKISPVVCYEIIFPNNVIDSSNPPDLIVNLTNDGWFGTSSGPYQHFVATKFRAIENEIPIIRVSNNGITVYIDEYGRALQKTKLNTTDKVDINFQPSNTNKILKSN